MNTPMDVAKGEHDIQEDDVYRTIKKHLEKNPEGKRIIKTFESDFQRNGDVLINYLRDELSKDDSLVEEIAKAHGNISKTEIKTIINGGEIGQIINIGQLDTLTVKKRFFLFRDVKQLLVFLTVFLFSAGGVFSVYWYSTQPRKLNGDFNIAIAQFGEITDDGIQVTALSRKISNSLLNYLDTEFRASDFGLKVDVSNKNMPLITEEADAEKLARRVEATIVIFGNVYVQNGEAKLSPRFWVSKDLDVDELTGEAELSKPIVLKIETLDDQEKVEQDLKARASILINFTYGLIYLADKNFDDAIYYVQDAINIAESSTDLCPKSGDTLCDNSFEGKENLYLVAAHIETSRAGYEVANQMLDQALLINPNYARAYIARGNIYYGQATQSTPNDDTLLEKALAEYIKAYEAKKQPKGANIPIKAHYSIGNIYFLRAQNENNNPELYLKAIDNYKFVTDQYEKSKNLSIQDLAARNYYNIGISYERVGNLSKAIHYYEIALETTSDSKDKAEFENQLNVTKETYDSSR